MSFKTLCTIAIFITISFCFEASAAKVKGTVEYIRVHGPEHTGGQWTPPLFWFTLNEVTSAESCSTYNGNVVWVAEHEHFLSILLATQATGSEIAIDYDESKTKNNFCRALNITTGKPPPL